MSGEAAMATLVALGTILAAVVLVPMAIAIGGALGFMTMSGLWP